MYTDELFTRIAVLLIDYKDTGFVTSEEELYQVLIAILARAKLSDDMKKRIEIALCQ